MLQAVSVRKICLDVLFQKGFQLFEEFSDILRGDQQYFILPLLSTSSPVLRLSILFLGYCK